MVEFKSAVVELMAAAVVEALNEDIGVGVGAGVVRFQLQPVILMADFGLCGG